MSNAGIPPPGSAEAVAPPQTSEAGSVGSVYGSRKGSSAVAVGDSEDTNNSRNNNASEQSTRRRSSLVAPSSGSNHDMDSSDGDGAAEERGTGGGGGGGAESVSGGTTAGGLRGEEGGGTGGGGGSNSEDIGVSGYQEVVTWIKDHLVLPGFAPERHWQETHDEVSCYRTVKRRQCMVKDVFDRYGYNASGERSLN